MFRRDLSSDTAYLPMPILKKEVNHRASIFPRRFPLYRSTR
jgi:hypothetical protein